MKRLLIFLTSLLLSVQCLAVSGDDAFALAKSVSQENTTSTFNQFDVNSATPPQSGGSGAATEYTLTANDAENKTRSLAPISTHNCALSSTQSHTHHHINSYVFKSGSHWYLNVSQYGNAGPKSATAVCWPY